MATLELSDLTNLTNDPIIHGFTWKDILSKVPLDIPKVKGKAREVP
jgi:hypothetical protein